ncbi:MAG: hypothetical protein II921_08255 [Treponema sp.]|nr:hypothetical protein [Treponema sp.]
MKIRAKIGLVFEHWLFPSASAIWSCCFLFFAAFSFAQTPSQESGAAVDDAAEKYARVKELLAGYLENDLQIQKYMITAQSKALSLDSTKISNGISVSLSTGEMSITTDTGSNRKITVSPNVKIAAPKAQDFSLSATVPITITENEKSVNNGSVSATIGLITGASKQAKVNVIEAERALLEAERAVKDRAVSAEKDFYTKLKTLYNYAVSVLKAKDDLFDDELDLRVLEVQGYSKTSASYRQKKLKVQSDRRDVQEKQRLLERETQIFAKKCGFEFVRSSMENDEKKFDPVKAGEEAYQQAIAFLPDSVPAERKDEVNIFKFKKEHFTEIEQALWNKHIGELKREAAYKMTLKATAEYKLNSSQSHYDDLGGKLTWAWRGITASGGMYFPLGTNLFDNSSTIYNLQKNDSPYFQFSLGFVLNDWKLASITLAQEKLDAALEDNAIAYAEDNYESEVMSKVSSFHDIKWNQRSYKEEYATYVQLADDMEKWLKQGIVTENDYLDALNNKEKTRINMLITDIDLLIYNSETKLLFHEDE